MTKKIDGKTADIRVRTTPELMAALRTLARRDGINASEAVRRFVTDGLTARKMWPPKSPQKGGLEIEKPTT